MTQFARATVVVLLAAACGGAGSGLTGVAGGGGASSQRILGFLVQPSGANTNEILTPAIQVAAFDTLGNIDATFSATVTVRLGGNPSGAALRGARSVPAVNGTAVFGDLALDRPGTGFTLVATAAGARTVTSAAFTVVTPERQP